MTDSNCKILNKKLNVVQNLFLNTNKKPNQTNNHILIHFSKISGQLIAIPILPTKVQTVLQT